MMSTATLLEATGLTKSFSGHAVLHGVDLQIREGEFLSVMGPSGSGKSTLLYTISGLDSMTSGAVNFEGQDLAALRQKELSRLRLTGMGFIFQHVHLLKNLSLLDNVVLPAYLARQAPRSELNDRAMELMQRTGVAELAHRDISEASGGQLQRVGICRALINQPKVVFGDEPTGALDSAAATEIMDILAELNAEGMAIMLVTHDPRVAARTDRVLYMLDGRIVGDRNQGRYAGADLDQRQAQLTPWLMSLDSAHSADGPPDDGAQEKVVVHKAGARTNRTTVS